MSDQEIIENLEFLQSLEILKEESHWDVLEDLEEVLELEPETETEEQK